MLLLHVADLAGTRAVASAIAGLVRPGDMIVLAGEMGAGKTAFAQALGQALGVTEPITSPTFTLVHSYSTSGKLTLHHADLYRLDRSAELEDLALHELAAFGGVVLVEWGDVVGGALGDHLEVRLSRPDDDAHDNADDEDAGESSETFGDSGAREIELHATGGSWAGRWDRLGRAVEAYRC
jgi:tRNA threonylcarbamoyladenosine biosynthesis protein TsaE